MMIAKPANNVSLIFTYVTKVFPQVKRELRSWKSRAEIAAEPELAAQALASIESKAFHCLGGSIYSLYPGADTERVIPFVTAYQTISDYLDNLVDSMGIASEAAFAQLHLAMTEALEPNSRASDYYLFYPFQADGQYLPSLVQTCRNELAQVPALSVIKAKLLNLAQLYSCLQVYKHLPQAVREEKMLTWAGQYQEALPEISPWEFSAASGSTLGIFALYAAASDPALSSRTAEQIYRAYFPWICGLHILLDYFIDLEEDRRTGQLNFVQYYSRDGELLERISFFLSKSLERAASLPHANFHRAVVLGLLAMYLSDAKGSLPPIKAISEKLIAKGGRDAKILRWVCSQLRKRQIL